MSPRLPSMTPREMVKALRKVGFRELRQNGSHLVLQDQIGRRVTVPMHTGDLDRSLAHDIIRQAGFDALQSFLDVL